MSAPRLKVERLLAERFRRKPASRAERTPIISFTFDDFPRSAWTVAGKMLDDRGLRGTYYVSRGLMGTTTAVGDICGKEDAEEVVAAGHELACHTFEHSLCSSLKAAEILASCRHNYRQVADEMGGYQMRSFSFPEGVVTLGAKAALSGFYRSCRTIEPGINRDPVDLGFLRANRIYSRFGLSGVKNLIDENARAKGWLILYTHDVCANPSPYGCTPQEFGEVLDWAVGSHSEILSVGAASERFQTN